MLHILVDALKLVFQPDNPLVDHSQFYKVHVQMEKGVVPKSKAPLLGVPQNKTTRTLGYWCFNPGVSMEAIKGSLLMRVILNWLRPLLNLLPDVIVGVVIINAFADAGTRCIILTSGTLSPLDSFAYELKT